MIKLPILACVALPLLTLGCKKSESKTAANLPADVPIRPDKPVGKVLAPPPGSNSPGWTKLPAPLQEALGEIHSGGPKIPNFMKAWDAIWKGEFDSPVTDNSPEATEGRSLCLRIDEIRTQAPESLSVYLSHGKTLQGFERNELAGVGGIYMGWAYDSENNHELYYLLRKRSNRLPQTEGDAVMAALSDTVVQMIEPSSSALEQEDLRQWGMLANGKNPVYRQIALRVFPRLTREEENRASFLKSYFQETDAAIKTEALVQISQLPSPPRDTLLNDFKDAQQAIGDTQFGEKIQQAIDRNP